MPYSIYHNLRYKALKSLTLLSASMLFLLAAINFYIGNTLLAWSELTIGLVASVCLWRFKRLVTAKTIQRFSVVFAIMMLCLMLYAISAQHLSFSVYMWVLLIPLIAYNLTGVLRGFVITSVFITLAVIIIIYKHSFALHDLDIKPVSSAVICILATWILTHLYESSNSRSKEELTHIASKDSLTGLYNRYALQEIFDEHKHTELSLIVLDIDFFKRINDTYGHDAGDYVLVVTSKILSAMSPSEASVFRLGGEEFGILLPKYTLETAAAFAHNAVLALRDNKIRYQDQIIHITTSAGVASTESLPSSSQKNQLSQLMQVADNRLYQAKKAGRDRVIAS